MFEYLVEETRDNRWLIYLNFVLLLSELIREKDGLVLHSRSAIQFLQKSTWWQSKSQRVQNVYTYT